MCRLYQSIVSSEDLKYDSGADCIFCERQIGMGSMLMKDGDFIGYIDECGSFLGDDVIIRKIKIYKDEELSRKLTEKYQSKILICSVYKDRFNS